MSELTILSLSLIILLLPIIGFAIVLLFGKRFPKIYLLEVGILVIGLILSIVLAFGKLTFFNGQDILFSFRLSPG
jgi:hypothetical protein